MQWNPKHPCFVHGQHSIGIYMYYFDERWDLSLKTTYGCRKGGLSLQVFRIHAVCDTDLTGQLKHCNRSGGSKITSSDDSLLVFLKVVFLERFHWSVKCENVSRNYCFFSFFFAHYTEHMTGSRMMILFIVSLPMFTFRWVFHVCIVRDGLVAF